MEDIAIKLGVAKSTISSDVSALKKQWSEEAQEDISQFVSRELAELDRMELEAAIMYQSFRGSKEKGVSPVSKEAGRWMEIRLKIKDKRERLLGLDKLTAMSVKKLEEQSKTSDDKILELKSAILESIKESKHDV